MSVREKEENEREGKSATVNVQKNKEENERKDREGKSATVNVQKNKGDCNKKKRKRKESRLGKRRARTRQSATGSNTSYIYTQSCIMDIISRIH